MIYATPKDSRAISKSSDMVDKAESMIDLWHAGIGSFQRGIGVTEGINWATLSALNVECESKYATGSGEESSEYSLEYFMALSI